VVEPAWQPDESEKLSHSLGDIPLGNAGGAEGETYVIGDTEMGKSA
jgi:hypothetical protein